MRKFILTLTVLCVATSLAFAKPKSIEFSLALPEAEAKTVPHKAYSYASRQGQKPKDILVSKELLFSNADIESIIIIRKNDSAKKEFPVIDLVFNKIAAEKLAVTTENNRTRSLAVIVEGKVLTAPVIILPMTKGHFMFSSWQVATDAAATQLVNDLGFSPVYKGEVKTKLVTDKK